MTPSTPSFRRAGMVEPAESASSSQSFWAEALAAAEELEELAAAGEGDAESKREGDGLEPEPEEPDPPSSPLFPSILSPDTSPEQIKKRKRNTDDPPAGRRVRFPSLSPPPPPSPPPDPPAITALATGLHYLPAQSSALGSHSYLAGSEYGANTFGDIGTYLRNKDIKVQTQNAQIAAGGTSRGLAPIFAGLTFYINGNTRPPMEVLRRKVLERGGTVVPFVRRKTEIDYVVAPVLTLAKFREWKSMRIVTEGFVVKSCEAGKMVDWKQWRLRPEGEMAAAPLFGGQLAKEKGESKVDKGEADIKPPRKAHSPANAGDDTPPVRTPTPRSQVFVDLPPPMPTPKRESYVEMPQFPDTERHGPPPAQPPHITPSVGQPVSLATPIARASSLLRPLRVPRSTPSQRPPAPMQMSAAAAPAQPPPTALQTALASPASPAALRATPLPGPPLEDDSGPYSTVPTPKEAIAANNAAEAFAESSAPPEDDSDSPTAPPPNAEASASKPRPEGTWENYYVHKSNKQAAHLMKSDAFRARHTSERGNEAGFIDQYYQNSRLHHLSTWKAELRVLVAEARGSAIRVPTVLAPAGEERIYLHVDFDAFFVSAGVASRPHLRGRPVVVCHSSRGGRESTSEVASASYEARALGVRNGMSLGRARQLVGPDLETIPYEFETYKKHSAAFYTVLLGYADELEAVSVDEALLDVTGAVRARALAPDPAGADPDPAVALAEAIRNDIRAATACEASIGIGPNLLLSRLATRAAKPAGVHRLRVHDAQAFLAELDVDVLPSVGHSARSKLRDAFSATTCGALLAHPKAALQRVLGPKTGEALHGFLRGLDARRLQPDKERKSVSAEMNYGIRFQNTDQAQRYVRDLAAEVGKRLRSIGARGRHLTLKIMVRHPEAPVEPPKFLGHGRCETVNRGAPLRALTDADVVIADEAVRLLDAMRLDPVELRGVGIMVTKLVVGPGKGQSVLDFGRRQAEEEEDESPEPEAEGELLGFVRSQEDKEAEPRQRPDTTPARPALASTSLLDTRLAPTPTVSAFAVQVHQPTPRPDPSQPSQPSQLDPEFLDALPADLRLEVEADHAARQERKRREKRQQDERQAGLDELDPDLVPHAAPAGPSKAATKLNPAAHITKQLRPKVKTHLSVKAVSELPLYSAWARARSRSVSAGPSGAGSRGVSPASEVEAETVEVIDVSENDDDDGFEVLSTSVAVKPAELRRLGIDPDVFAALPPDMRAEIVVEERRKARRSASASISPHPLRIGAPRGHARGPTTTRGAGARARTPPRAAVTVRPALFGARETDDVCDVLSRWVHNRPRPAAADVQRVAGYLAKSVVHGLGGLEHASALLRCVRGMLSDMEAGGRCADDVRAWWDAWEGIKAEVDKVLVDRMGAPLRL